MSLNTLPRVIPIPNLHVRIFLLQSQDGYALIDAGMPFHERKIERVLHSLDVGLADIQTILLTHGHLDHIGCLSYLKTRSRAKLICHKSIQAPLENGSYEPAVPRVMGWKLLNPLLSGLLGKRISPIQPDRVFEESLDLRELGIHGMILHTPGHSPGSCSILLDGGICFMGDLLRESSPGSFDTGLFYHDRDQILASLKKIAALKPETIYLSHGTRMAASALEEFLDRADHSGA